MANYTVYIPQLNSTTYPTSISNCFTQLTTDVTALETGKLDKAGDTMTGALVLSGNPTVDLHAVPRQYVTSELANYLPLSGGTLSGGLTISSGTVTIGSDAVAVKDAALTDTYVVTADASGRITTTTAIAYTDLARLGTISTFTTIPAFNGGTSGVDAPFTVDSTYVVTNLNADLLDGQQGSYYAPIASPAFTGNPTAVTLAYTDSSTKLATTAFVAGHASSYYAALSGATFTGNVTLPTMTVDFIRESVQYVNALSDSPVTVDVTAGTYIIVVMNANCDITFSNLPAATTQTAPITLEFQYSGAYTITWGSHTIKWDGGTVPTWGSISGDIDIVTMWSLDAGTNFYANLVGQNYA